MVVHLACTSKSLIGVMSIKNTKIMNYNYQYAKRAISFESICNRSIQNLPSNAYPEIYKQLDRGRARLTSYSQAVTYMACYGKMHILKLQSAYERLFNQQNLSGKSVNIIDWGCGQALATGALIDHIKNNNIKMSFKSITLIEPSRTSIQIGVNNLKRLLGNTVQINTQTTTSTFARLKPLQSRDEITIHLFSNLLDIDSVSNEEIANKIKRYCKGQNYFVCVSPLNIEKLCDFYESFSNSQLISHRKSNLRGNIYRIIQGQYFNQTIYRIEYIFKTFF